MSQEVQLFFICPFQEQERQKNSYLQDYKYLQFVGKDKNLAILHSLIHYAFNRKQQKILLILYDYISSSNFKPYFKDIGNLIKETIDLKNPVQKFFQNLSMIYKNNQMVEQLLFEFCKSKNLVSSNQINYHDLAKFFQVRVSFQISNQLFGDGRDSIDILDKNGNFFYLIPDPIILQSFYCRVCKITIEYIQLQCSHKQCSKCLNKKQFVEQIKCCSQLNNKAQINQKLKELQKLKDYNERSKILINYYESTYSNLPLYQQQTKINNITNDQSNIIDSQQECNLCYKKPKQSLFVLKECKHQFCYQCILLNNSVRFCFKDMCAKIIDQQDLQKFILQNRDQNLQVEQEVNNYSGTKDSQISQIPKEQEFRIDEQCSKCLITHPYKLFQIQQCNHKFCNTCLQVAEIKQYSNRCLISKCQETFKKQDYNKYIQYLQDNSKLVEIQNKSTISYQNKKQFQCSKCFQNVEEDFKYTLNCGHNCCKICIFQNLNFYQKCCSSAIQDQDFQNFRNSLFTNCSSCQNEFSQKNLLLLKCKHLVCLNCCIEISKDRFPRCIIKNCERYLFPIDDLSNFIYEQTLELSKQSEPRQEQNNTKQNAMIEPKSDKISQQKIDINYNKQEQMIENKNQSENSNHQENEKKEEKPISVMDKKIKKSDYKIPNKDQTNLVQQQLQEKMAQSCTKSINPILENNIKQQEKQDDFQQTDCEDEIIFYQQLQEITSIQIQESLQCEGTCTNCKQEFSVYNRRQDINCKYHQIGVCCTLLKFKDCPQCEQRLSRIVSIKQKLILPTNPVEVEITLDSTIMKQSSQIYNTQSYQQTQYIYSDQVPYMDRYKNNQGTAIKRNITADSFNKRISESQQFIDDKYKLRNDLQIRNEQTILKSPPYYQNRLDRQNYYRQDSGLKIGFPIRDQIQYTRFQPRQAVRLI